MTLSRKATTMLTITATKNEAQAKKYFANELSRGDYYLQDESSIGFWGGKASEYLGLSGEVQDEQFYRLCENRRPDTGRKLTQRTVEGRRIYFDCQFSCPKSISLLYGFSRDPNLLKTFHKAVKDTLVEMEEKMSVRVRAGGQDKDRTTGNMLYSFFTHFTARPEEGMCDPQLHAHAVVFNASFDGVENKWKASQFHDIKKDSPYYQAAFLNRLAVGIKELGFGVEAKPNGQFEVAGFDKDLLLMYSRRTQKIEQVAKELNITNQKTKATLATRTRKAKLKENTSFAELQKEWVSRLSDKDKETLSNLDQFKDQKNDTTLEKCFDFAVEHSFERLSVLSETKLWESVLRKGVGALSVEEVKQHRNEKIIYAESDNGRMVSTVEVLKEEMKMMELAKDGKGTCVSLGKYDEKKDGVFNEKQVGAIKYLLEENHDRITILSGAAGVGKSTLLKEVKSGIERGKKQVLALAPSTGAKEVLCKDGFEADTLQKFLANPEMQEQYRNQVIILDEAGLVGSKPMLKLFEIANDNNMRVILSGDNKQHHSTDRGDAFKLLQEKRVLTSFRLDEVVRQRGNYRDAMVALSENRLDAALGILDDLGWVEQHEPEKIYQKIADAYTDELKIGVGSALAIAPTNLEGRIVTDKIRDNLKKSGVLDAKTEKKISTVYALNLTEAEKGEFQNYCPGDKVIFHKHQRGFKNGQVYEIKESSKSGVFLVSDGGKQLRLPIQHKSSFSLFQDQILGVAKHDRIRIKANGKTKDGDRLVNGNEYTVKGFDFHGNPILNNGWVLDDSFKQWDLAYTSTSHSAQGKTVDKVFVLQDWTGKGAISREGFYVSTSRAREQCRIFTTSKFDLRELVEKSSSRMSATELAFVEQQQKKQKENTLKLMRMAQMLKKKLQREQGNKQVLQVKTNRGNKNYSVQMHFLHNRTVMNRNISANTNSRTGHAKSKTHNSR